MARQKSILTISRDERLQRTRTLVLERGGFRVIAVHTDSDALASIDSEARFDLVLLCHTVPEESRVLLAAKIKESHPSWPIMVLYNGYDPPREANVDGALQNLESPKQVLEMVDFLTSDFKRPS